MYNKTVILVYNYSREADRMKVRFEDVNITEKDEIAAKSVEDYILDLLYDSGYMEH